MVDGRQSGTTEDGRLCHGALVLIRDPQGAFPTPALLCTAREATPSDIRVWFIQRWPREVTFAEARAHRGLETQRQGNDKAIARTTPILWGLFSVVTLLAHRLLGTDPSPTRQTAWYTKTRPPFALYAGPGASASVDPDAFRALTLVS